MPDYLIHKSKTGIANTAEWQETDMHQLQNQAAGDILYAADGTKLTRLAVSTDGKILMLASGLPSWQALFDTTHPADLGTAAEGSAAVAAKRDHVHTLPKLDDLSAPDANTDLDATTTAHGLVLKAVAPASPMTNVVAIENGETVYKLKALFDTTHPEALGTAAEGSAATAARRDHVHANPVVAATDPGGAALLHVMASVNGATVWSVVDIFDATNPAALGAAAAPGTAVIAAHRDHVHLDPVVAHAAAADPHTGYFLESNLDNTAGGTDGATTKAPTSNAFYDHAVAKTGVHGTGALYLAKSTTDGLDLSGHASRHQGYGADPLSIIENIIKTPLYIRAWDNLDGTTNSGATAQEQYVSLSTAAAASSYAYVWFANANCFVYAANSSYDVYWGTYFAPRSVTTYQDIWIGLFNVPGAPPTMTNDHIGFWLSQGDLYCTSADAGTQKTTDTTINVSQYEIVYLNLIIKAGVALFYVNGVLRGTHTGAGDRVPDLIALYPAAIIGNAAAPNNVAKNMLVYPMTWQGVA